MSLVFDKVLSIGINYVGTSSELRGCVNDVIQISKNVVAKSMVTMTELSSDPKLIPTRQNMLNQIDLLVKDAKAGDRLLFQYSGHGSYERDRNGDEEDGRDEVICPLDYDSAGCISDDVIKAHLIDPLPEGCKLFAIFDSCHSGTIVDLGYNYRVYPRDDKRKYVTRRDAHYADTKCDVICLSGCEDPQTSADAYITGKYQGAMTWGFLASVNEIKNKKQDLSYHNVMKTLLSLMKQKRYEQVPQITSGRSLNLDDQMWMFV